MSVEQGKMFSCSLFAYPVFQQKRQNKRQNFLFYVFKEKLGNILDLEELQQI